MAIPGPRSGGPDPGPRIGDPLFADPCRSMLSIEGDASFVRERSSSEDRELPRAEPRWRCASARPRCDAVMFLADAELGRIFKN